LTAQHRGNLVSHGFVDSANRVCGKMRIFFGSGAFGMTKKIANDWQRRSTAHTHAGE
jgi:hypothetical protein